MSVRDVAQDLHKSSRTIGKEKILQILTQLQKRIPKIEDEDAIRFLMYSPLVDLHDTSITLGGTPNISKTRNNDHFGGMGYRKYIPVGVKSYSLTHDNSGASGISFNTPGQGVGAVNHGAAITNGNSHILIKDHTLLDLTSAFTIGGWLYIPSTVTPAANDNVFSKDNVAAGSPYMLRFTNATTLEMRMTATTNYTRSFTPATNSWFFFATTWKGAPENRFRVYINAVQQGADITTSGALATNSLDVGIFGKPNGGSELKSGIGMAHFFMASEEASASWLSDAFTKRILDFDTDNNGIEEVTYIPFIDTLRPMPNAFSGMCVSKS